MTYSITRYGELASTNDLAKELAADGAPEGTVIIAEKQSRGRGRAGHTFFSPRGGIYMSVILRPGFPDYMAITPAAAVAVCRALDMLGFDCGIKWVNDIYKDGKKVCGILTEASVTDGWAVLGIGINTVCPGPGAPEIAGWLYDDGCDNDKTAKLVLECFGKIYEDLPDRAFVDYYRQRSILTGRKVIVNGKEYTYEGIDDDFSLIVSDKNKKIRFICGEVSVTPQ